MTVLEISVIVVLILGVVFCVGGPILGSIVTKRIEKAEREDADRAKSK